MPNIYTNEFRHSDEMVLAFPLEIIYVEIQLDEIETQQKMFVDFFFSFVWKTRALNVKNKIKNFKLKFDLIRLNFTRKFLSTTLLVTFEIAKLNPMCVQFRTILCPRNSITNPKGKKWENIFWQLKNIPSFFSRENSIFPVKKKETYCHISCISNSLFFLSCKRRWQDYKYLIWIRCCCFFPSSLNEWISTRGT